MGGTVPRFRPGSKTRVDLGARRVVSDTIKTAIEGLALESHPLRNERRKELRSILHDRQKMVDTLLKLKQGSALEECHTNVSVPAIPTVRIKRYRNE